MKKLLIVESPAKIKTISKFLGPDFKIMSTVGHIMDLPSKSLGITMGDKNIELEYVPLDKKEKTIAEICRAAATSDEIFLAPDPDREGEIIAWHIGQEILKLIKDPSKIHRITFNEITAPAIQQAIKEKTDVDLNKVAAQQARRVLDRWVGYEVSPVLWRKLQKGLSAGRVQSVVLRLICEREEEIRNFKPEEYWSITALFGHGKDAFEAALTHIGKKKAEIGNADDAKKIAAEIKKAHFVITEINDKERTKNPLPPFMTSTLQQAAFNRLGFTVKKTMTIAQKLYEGVPLKDPSTPVALITYMRTDSLRLSDTAIDQARGYISKTFAKDYLPPKALVYAKGGKAQDAHEAIRPIDASITPDIAKQYLAKDEARLYELIWQRFIACQMKSALYAQRQVVIEGDKFIFKITGSTLIFDGFLKVYGVDAEDEDEKKVAIPKDIKKNDTLELNKLDPKQHFTQPPPKYTEGSMVKEMEKEGIGRPSTYNATLSTLQTREYVTLDKKKFVPTELGMAVTKMLVENLPKIMNVKFTALMEEDLDKIASGEMARDTLLREFYAAFKKDLDAFLGTDSAKKAPEPTDVDCPQCKKHKLAIRFGKSGAFLGCLGYPECTFTSNFKRDENGVIELTQTEAPKVLDELCPNCGKNLREVRGKFGIFKACSGYPDCKYIPQEKAAFKCPSCKTGDFIKRKWRGGTMYGCSNYPKCKFAVFSDIEETPCPKCKLPFLMKKEDKNGKVTLLCSDKNCGYKKED